MKSNQAFFNEIRDGNVKAVEQLLTEDSSLIKLRDQRGSSPLILATYYNHQEITNVLLKKKLVQKQNNLSLIRGYLPKGKNKVLE